MKSKKFVTYAKKNLVLMKMIKMDLNYTVKSEIIVITLENLEELLIVFAIDDTKHQKKFRSYFIVALHMITTSKLISLQKKFYGQLECLGENTEKHITFSVPIRKELDNGKKITYRYRLKFTDSFTFMSTSLSSLVDDLSEKLHSDKSKDCKYVLSVKIIIRETIKN